MKYYIEKDYENKVVTKGITSDDAVIKLPLIEVTEGEYRAIDQYIPHVEELPKELTMKEEIEELKQLVADLRSEIVGDNK